MDIRIKIDHTDDLFRVLGSMETGANEMMMLAGVEAMKELRTQVQTNIQNTFTMRSGLLYHNWKIGDPEGGWEIDQATAGYRGLGPGGKGPLSSSSIIGGSGANLKIGLFTDTVYARIQELGGTIRPVHAKMLSWVGDDGVRHFAMKVEIPARPYFRPAENQAKSKMDSAFSRTVEQYITRKIGPAGWVR